MKQKDIALLVVIAFLSALLSFFISNKIFVTPATRQQKVQIVDPIDSNFKVPNSRYLNSQSINSTQPVTIGNNNNPNPLSGASH